MRSRIVFIAISVILLCAVVEAQTREPSKAIRPFVVKTKQEVSDITKTLERQSGNKTDDVAPTAGTQMRVAVFHDEKRVDDLVELHDASDDVYYVLDGKAVLMLGGVLDDPSEISPGEWRSKTATGGQTITIKKGDLIVVPRGTPHQRTVTGKGFSMILVKVFADNQPVQMQKPARQ